jgi:hypothetical protein
LVSENRRFADTVVIRHVCDCRDAIEHPGVSEANEHIFSIDGQEFPWHIKKVPGVTLTDCGYTVTVEILAHSVDAVGVPIQDRRSAMADTWQARLFREHDELCERIAKLRAFISTPEFSTLAQIDQDDLHMQLAYMTRYGHVLTRRVERAVN